MTVNLSKNLAPHGITVNAVPGTVTPAVGGGSFVAQAAGLARRHGSQRV
jgi:hypothetical protein